MGKRLVSSGEAAMLGKQEGFPALGADAAEREDGDGLQQ
jgi:hypothetical protein